MNFLLQEMSSGSDEFQSSPNVIQSMSSTNMLASSNTNNMNGLATGENGCGGLVVIKQEPNAFHDYKSITNNYNSSNSTETGCNMLQKVPSLSDLSDPENSLGM